MATFTSSRLRSSVAAAHVLACGTWGSGCIYDWEPATGGFGGTGGVSATGSGALGPGGGGAGGDGGAGGTLPPLDLDTVQPIAVGGTHACATLQGVDLRCWGSNSHGQLGSTDSGFVKVPDQPWNAGNDDKVIAKIVAGFQHTCVLIETGEVYCWGDNSRGQLGRGSEPGDMSMPTLVNLSAAMSGSQVKASDLAAGAYHTCASTFDKLYCWGANDQGQVGLDNAFEDVSSPTIKEIIKPNKEGNVPDHLAIAAGASHTCARYEFISADIGVACWGSNDRAQLGEGPGDGPPQIEPRPVNYSFVTCSTLSAGLGDHTCCVDDGSIVCWGRNDSGQSDYDDGDPVVEPRAVALAFETPELRVWVGTDGTCARGTLLAGSSVSTPCWGNNTLDLLGVGLQNPLVPAEDVGWTEYNFVAFNQHACGMTSNAISCWGNNDVDQVDDAVRAERWIEQADAVTVFSP